MRNLIPLWLNLSRAYQIAKLGGFKINVVYKEDYINAPRDYLEIKKFYGEQYFSAEGEITLEIYPPMIDNRWSKTLDDIKAEVEDMVKYEIPTSFQNKDASRFVQLIHDRLKVSVKEYETLLRVAGVIAQFSGSSHLYTEHIAESTMYVKYEPHADVISAESPYVNFGGILIPKAELDQECIKKARRHLKNLIK